MRLPCFSKAKRILLNDVYYDHKQTLYCNAKFNQKKQVIPKDGFTTRIYKKRAKRIEWEHVVPAENFGRAFSAWRKGDARCIKRNGKKYKGRKCGRKVSREFRLIEADMYNLFPAIGAINAARSNYNFTQFSNERSDFGTCNVKIDNRLVEPPKEARGRIARTYLYMDAVYDGFNMSKQQRKLMEAWDKKYPGQPHLNCLPNKCFSIIIL